MTSINAKRSVRVFQLPVPCNGLVRLWNIRLLYSCVLYTKRVQKSSIILTVSGVSGEYTCYDKPHGWVIIVLENILKIKVFNSRLCVCGSGQFEKRQFRWFYFPEKLLIHCSHIVINTRVGSEYAHNNPGTLKKLTTMGKETDIF